MEFLEVVAVIVAAGVSGFYLYRSVRKKGDRPCCRR